jgi:large subunit ribosomal protein L22
MLKRLRTAPQGRGHRIRKRSNHVNLILDNKILEAQSETENVTNTEITENN